MTVPYELNYRHSLRSKFHKLPSELFHYTGAEGLHGIIEKGELWATHLYHVNDMEEFKYAKGVVLKAFEARIEGAAGSERELLEQFRAAYNDYATHWEDTVRVYISCFCEHGDLLSQWRAYGANGKGFALGMSPESIQKHLTANHSGFGGIAKWFRVIYEKEEQSELVNGEID